MVSRRVATWGGIVGGGIEKSILLQLHILDLLHFLLPLVFKAVYNNSKALIKHF